MSAPDSMRSPAAAKDRRLHAEPIVSAPSLASSHILLGLFAFRLANALTLRTFFQPDEYFQSLEPAWQIAFGSGSGAWITWVSSPHISPPDYGQSFDLPPFLGHAHSPLQFDP